MGLPPVRILALAFAALGSACTACGETHPVRPPGGQPPLGWIDHQPEGRPRVDVLVVLGNGPSMWEEQELLRAEFDTLVERLESHSFQIGVTTTAATSAQGLTGALSTAPRPYPAFDRAYHVARDEHGQPIARDYTPIREMIAAAVDCMSTPDESYNAVTTADIECALYGEPARCTIARAQCGTERACIMEDLFPPAGAYRQVPAVLKSDDYKSGATLDTERLRGDFACLALVGTRSYGPDKGLEAATRAVSRAMTGGVTGVDDADTSAPNHGLLRPYAQFALLFVTDRNDCSHDGSLVEDGACGLDACEFANGEGTESGLLEPSGWRYEFLEALRASKGDAAFGEADVFVGSIHGTSRRFAGEVPTEAQCASADYVPPEPVCSSPLGEAGSGDRYERFLREAPEGQFFPPADPTSPDDALPGWMCAGDFTPALAGFGELIHRAGLVCITEDFFPCTSDMECPEVPFGDGEGRCSVNPHSGEGYCDSAVVVLARAPTDEGFANLGSSGFCVDESVGATADLVDGCVIDRSHYALEPCVSGFAVRWLDEDAAREALQGSYIVVKLRLREIEGGL